MKPSRTFAVVLIVIAMMLPGLARAPYARAAADTATWVRYIPNTPGRLWINIFDVTATADGGALATGSYVIADPGAAYGPGHGYLAKVRADGTIAWSRQFDVFATFVRPVPGGGCVMAGLNSLTSGNPGGDVVVLRLDTEGRTVWRKSYTTYTFEVKSLAGLVRTPDGWILGGSVMDWNSPDQWGKLWAMRINDAGELVWQKIYGVDGYPVWSDSLEPAMGGFLFCANAEANNSCPGSFVLRMGLDGTVLTKKMLSWPSGEGWIDRGIELKDGKLLVVGSYGPSRAALLDAGGGVIWFKSYSSVVRPQFFQVIPDGGGWVLGGGIDGGNDGGGSSGFKAALVRIDAQGLAGWRKSYGTGPSNPGGYPTKLVRLAGGGLLIVGENLLAKVDSDGGVGGCSEAGSYPIDTGDAIAPTVSEAAITTTDPGFSAADPGNLGNVATNLVTAPTCLVRGQFLTPYSMHAFVGAEERLFSWDGSPNLTYRFEYAQDEYGYDWKKVADGLTPKGLRWRVPSVKVPGRLHVRVTGFDSGGDAAVNFQQLYSIAPLIVAEFEEGYVEPGETSTITWRRDRTLPVAKVRIFYKTCGAWHLLATLPKGATSWNWAIPADIGTSLNCWGVTVKVILKNAAGGTIAAQEITCDIDMPPEPAARAPLTY